MRWQQAIGTALSDCETFISDCETGRRTAKGNRAILEEIPSSAARTITYNHHPSSIVQFHCQLSLSSIMHVFRSAAAPVNPVDPLTFIGPATVQRLAEDGTGVAVGVYRVSFAAGGRTNWHSHSGPQWLFVVGGRIRVQRQGEAAQDLSEGDAVVFAPGEKHWHGAVPGTTGTHLAVNVNVATTWLEAVSESEYNAVAG
jgi:quercetin dioxygenase-like cupin family protein